MSRQKLLKNNKAKEKKPQLYDIDDRLFLSKKIKGNLIRCKWLILFLLLLYRRSCVAKSSEFDDMVVVVCVVKKHK